MEAEFEDDLFKLQPWGKTWPRPRGYLSGTQLSNTGPSCLQV